MILNLLKHTQTLFISVYLQLPNRKVLKSIMGRNKQVTCEICFKPMRSDNLKRHYESKHILSCFPSSSTKEEDVKQDKTEVVEQAPLHKKIKLTKTNDRGQKLKGQSSDQKQNDDPPTSKRDYELSDWDLRYLMHKQFTSLRGFPE
jgi:hypothetical protein